MDAGADTLNGDLTRWPLAVNSLDQRLQAVGMALVRARQELDRARGDYRALIELTRQLAVPRVFGATETGRLTTAERRVATLAVVGMRDAEIGAVLRISVHTVRSHMKSILRKLDLHSRWQLVELLASDTGEPSTWSIANTVDEMRPNSARDGEPAAPSR